MPNLKRAQKTKAKNKYDNISDSHNFFTLKSLLFHFINFIQYI